MGAYGAQEQSEPPTQQEHISDGAHLSISHSLWLHSYFLCFVCRKWRMLESIKSWPFWGGGGGRLLFYWPCCCWGVMFAEEGKYGQDRVCRMMLAIGKLYLRCTSCIVTSLVMFAQYTQWAHHYTQCPEVNVVLVFCMGMGNPWVFCGFFHGYGYGYENWYPQKNPYPWVGVWITHGFCVGHRFLLFWNKCCKIDVACSNYIQFSRNQTWFEQVTSILQHVSPK